MRKFLIKGIIFALPLIVIFVVVYIVDPYYLYHKDRSFSQEMYDIDYSFDQGRRYKIITFLNDPKPNIIMGASEINVIHERNIPEQGWHSLSFGGAPLQESLDLFWKMTKTHEIKRIIFAPEFIKFYNDCLGEFYSWNASHSSKAFELFENKPDYLLDKNVIRATYYYLVSELGVSSDKNKPNMTKDDFWHHQLMFAEGQYNQRVADATFNKSIAKLKEFAGYCRDNDIEVTIVIPAQHQDLTKIEFRDVSYPIYRQYLSSLIEMFGTVYYFDYPNQVTSNFDSFSDPFHLTDESIYINALWKNDDKYCLVFRGQSDLCQLDSIRNKTIIKSSYNE